MNEKLKNSKTIVYLIIAFFVGCLAMYAVVYYFPTSITESVTKLEKDVTVTDTGIADAVEKVYDAVVVVSTYKDSTLYASGTGFVYKKDGDTYYILTNHHVIESGNKVTVTFTDGSILDTTIVGSDEYSDIAVLSLESSSELTVAQLGNTDDVRVGDTSFAVGAPLDSAYSWTVTRGIISGKDRMVEVSLSDSSSSSDYVMKVLQTDTAINSGNSGGPLCNANGEVIGITSLKLVSSGVEGMGFAIPIEVATSKAEQIIAGESIEYPYIGIAMADVSTIISLQGRSNTYTYYNIVESADVTSGVLITSVEEGSAADDAGLKEGDIVVSLNDEEVKNGAYLKYYLYQYNVSDSVTIKVIRDGKEKELTVKLGTSKQTM